MIKTSTNHIMKIINRLLVISLTLVCVAMLGGCSVVNNSSKFAATEVELGMSRDEFVGRFGQPYNKEMSYTRSGEKEEVLYYKEDVYLSCWYTVTAAFVFVDSRLVEQRIVDEERIFNDTDRRPHKK